MSYTLAYTGAEIDALLGKIDAIFVAEYGSTIYSEVTAAIAAQKEIIAVKDSVVYDYAGQDGNGGYVFSNTGADVSGTSAIFVVCASDSTWSVATGTVASLVSPAFTGTPTAPTAATGTNNSQIATTAFVQSAIQAAVAGTVYGFHINGAESDPESAVTYLAGAVGMTPAYMDFANNVFNYGSWGNAFFMPRPCMLKYDGTVDYYLDPADYSKKAYSSEASDIADVNYGGNAMMEWGRNGKKIWYKIVPDSGDDSSASIFIADYQADEDFKCWSFINNQGVLVDHFYTPIYNGASDSSNRMRSLSGKTITYNIAASDERTRCRANNTELDIWDTEVYCDSILINLLLILISKTLDSQAAFGLGKSTGTSSTVLASGTMDAMGLFWGSLDPTNGVKVFGMENWYGNVWRRIGGLVNASGTVKYKLTRTISDGTTVNDYVINNAASAYSGYLTGGSVPAGASGAYITAMKFDSNQFTPSAVAGSSSTYYCDGFWSNNNQTDYAFRGGYASGGSLVGAYSVDLSALSTFRGWVTAAAPSCKPLAI